MFEKPSRAPQKSSPNPRRSTCSKSRGGRRLRLEQLERREVMTATLGFTGDYALDNWTAESIPNGVTTITPASGELQEATFGYDLELNSGGFNREQTVEFLTTAAETGTVTFDYEFTGNSNFFRARALFDSVSGSGATPVLDESTFDNFSLSGSASFIAQQGENLGFRIGGGNSDSNRDIDGELRITNIVFHDEILTPIVVDTDSDIDDGDLSPGNLSLREAVRLANETAGADTITFDESLAGSTITLTAGQLELRSSITINGLGAKDLTVSGGGQSRVFSEEGNGQRIIEITDMTIADGMGSSTDRGGGFFSNGGDVTLRRVVMTGNGSGGNEGTTIVMAFGRLEIIDSAIVGNLLNGVGAIRLQDMQTTITNTTISGNATRGISVFNSSSNADRLSLDSVTIANNANEGIEVVAFAGTTLLEYQNTLFANNGGQGSIDARGNDAGLPGLTITSLGHNLLDDTPAGDAAHAVAVGDLRDANPRLDELADNGGPTPTHALLEGSPAIDAGNSPLVRDQRGFLRPFDVAGVANAVGGNSSDIGAFERFAIAVLPGDYNLDGAVNGIDYAVWREQLGATGLVPFSGADGNGDGAVTGADADVWRNNFGLSAFVVAPSNLGATIDSPAVSEQASDAAFALLAEQRLESLSSLDRPAETVLQESSEPSPSNDSLLLLALPGDDKADAQREPADVALDAFEEDSEAGSNEALFDLALA